GGAQAYYGWGYGGQMIYVIPEARRSIAITSNPNTPSARTGYRDQLHALAATLATA
ncbi:MAG: 6-aminohexanoate hydrolase, partial [Pseudomonadota bacterium]